MNKKKKSLFLKKVKVHPLKKKLIVKKKDDDARKKYLKKVKFQLEKQAKRRKILKKMINFLKKL